jgi:hypothetical protein
MELERRRAIREWIWWEGHDGAMHFLMQRLFSAYPLKPASKEHSQGSSTVVECSSSETRDLEEVGKSLVASDAALIGIGNRMVRLGRGGLRIAQRGNKHSCSGWQGARKWPHELREFDLRRQRNGPGCCSGGRAAKPDCGAR